MKAGQITAKLRDAVPVRFMENGEEMKRYKKIFDIPDSLKKLEIQDFQFDIATDGKITFQLFFEEGILPDIFPANRVKMTRAEKAEQRRQRRHASEPDAQPVIVNISEPIPIIENMEVKYSLTGERRKELVEAYRQNPKCRSGISGRTDIRLYHRQLHYRQKRHTNRLKK